MPGCTCYPHGYDAKDAPGVCVCQSDPIIKVGDNKYIRKKTGEEMVHRNFFWERKSSDNDK